MKFYSYSNKNKNYTKAIALDNIRSLYLNKGEGKSEIRFSVRAEYADNHNEQFLYLYEDEAKQVYEAILKLLNQ